MIKLFEMFSGYGGASFALKKAGIEFETVGFSEIDKYAVQCYEQNHKGKNFGDCTKIKIEDLPNFDLLTGGFPCQSFSIAGKGLGELDTRGTLFNEIIRIAEAKQPKYMLLENVKGLTFKTHKKTFDKILSELDRIGYVVDWKVLNSKEHGIPQNRERVFFVCYNKNFIAASVDYGYKIKDARVIPIFQFPEKEELKIFIKDILEDEVEDKYFLSEKSIKNINRNFGSKGKILNLTDDISLIEKMSYPSRIKQIEQPKTSPILTSAMGNGGGNVPVIVTVNKKGEKIKNIPSIGQAKRIYSGEGITPALNVGWTPKVYMRKINNNHNKCTDRQDGVSFTLTSSGRNCGNNLGVNNIRKLTPTECFRLMGFLNDEIKTEGLSNTQKYKLAGNGWDINLVSKILKEMFKK